MGRFPRLVNAAVLIFGGGDNGTKELKEVVLSVVANDTVRSIDGSATGEEGMLCAAKERDRSSSPSALLVEVEL